ncbi:MAG: hypothetical protein NZ700_00805 [Gemmataceae bacterium]|nr:hypothetical protein [Gemmataceae bacterium]MDW8266368.1 hypothetical protein [Gemmataceae bacterium]
MRMVCPQCRASYEQRTECPTCGVRLLFAQAPQRPGSGIFGEAQPWPQTPWGRFIAGVVLAQGLYYGLWQLAAAIRLMVDADGDQTRAWWEATPAGFFLLQGLQALALIAGGMVAGAGQPRGLVYGGVVGIWSGAITLLIQFLRTQPSTAVELYAQPLVQGAVGSLGGWLGAWIWKAPVLPTLEAAPFSPPPVPKSRAAVSWFHGPIDWLRVLAGLGIVVTGSMSANAIRDFVVMQSGGELAPATAYQAHFLTWEISILVMLVGSAVAGANTRNGLKQGLAVGVLGGATLAAVYFLARHPPPQTLLLAMLVAQPPPVLLYLATVGSALVFCAYGGWFGSQLLPPIYAAPRPRGLGPLSY